MADEVNSTRSPDQVLSTFRAAIHSFRDHVWTPQYAAKVLAGYLVDAIGEIERMQREHEKDVERMERAAVAIENLNVEASELAVEVRRLRSANAEQVT